MDSSSLLVVRSWRISRAEPSGMMMWFDPSIEAPMLRSLTPEQRRSPEGLEPLSPLGGTIPEEGVVPCEGSDPSVAKTDLEDELPF